MIQVGQNIYIQYMRFSGTTYMREKEILLLCISDEYFGMCT